jgi:Alanine-zipper, major outer membrane lipoprotein
MKNTVANTLKVGVAALFLVTAAGCATTEQLNAVRATAEKGVQDAAAAKSAADAAASAAAAARTAADGAQNAANRALTAAQASQACCDATNEKIDRMFKQTQSK